MTELFFKTTLEQGQLLDAKLTFNTSERFNFSLAYIGFRSLGKYQFDEAESGRFRTTFNYVTRNNRYMVRGHYAAQDLDGEENGGLLSKELSLNQEMMIFWIVPGLMSFFRMLVTALSVSATF